MRSFKLIACAALAAAALGGLSACASDIGMTLSDSRIGSSTAARLNRPQNDLTISDRRTVGFNTYYTATAADGTAYDCSLNGGGIMAAGAIQMVECTPKST